MKGCVIVNITKDTIMKRFIDILEGNYANVALTGTVTTSGVLELMDISGASRPEADREPEIMAKLAASLHNTANFEIIRYPFDVTVLGEALGCEIDCGTRARTPAVLSHPFEKRPGGVEVPSNLLELGRIPVVLETSRLLSNDRDLQVPIVAGLEGPADLASYLCGIRTFMKWTIKKPELVSEIISKCIDACTVYANACLDSGADAVVIADSMASPDMIGPDAFREYLKPGLMRLTRDIRGRSIIHICGQVDSIVPDMLDCDFDAISIEENVKDLKGIVSLAHKNNTAVIGNVSTSVTLYSKNEDDVMKESIECLEAGIDILAPGCGLAPETPLKNLQAMVKARDIYYSR